MAKKPEDGKAEKPAPKQDRSPEAQARAEKAADRTEQALRMKSEEQNPPH